MKKRLSLCFLLLFGVLISTQMLLAEQSRGTVLVDDSERSFHVYTAEDFNPEESVPLLIALHDFAGSGTTLQYQTDLNQVADELGYVVVYPDAGGFAWDGGRDLDILGAGDDVAFIPKLIDAMVEQYNVDESQVYLLGYGNGASFAYRAACLMPEKFEAVIAVSALLWNYQLDLCPDEQAPVNLFIMVGDEDVHYPPNGRRLPTVEDLFTLNISQNLGFWFNQLGCNEEQYTVSDDSGLVVYDPCNEGKTIAFYVIEGAGYMWNKIGDYHLNRAGFSTTDMLLQYLQQDEDWMNIRRQDSVSSLRRTWRLHIPDSYDGSQAVPLVIALHGRPDTGAGFAVITDWNSIADKYGFIMVYPDGINQGWNYVRGLPLYPDMATAQDDVEFLSLLIDDLSVDLNIDQSRIYATGFSNGGFMTQRLACENPDQYAAFAAVGAGLRPEFIPICDGTNPVPMLLMHGTEDVSIPWDGIVTPLEVSSMPVPDTFDFWISRNGCTPEHTRTDIEPGAENPQTIAHHFVFTECEYPTEVYVIEGGGHNWPGRPDIISDEIAGLVNTDIHGGEVIWAFFREQVREIAEE